MTISQVQVLGFVAGTLTTFAFLPEDLRTRRTGGEDLSWTMLSMFGLGAGLWFVYGILVNAPPIIGADDRADGGDHGDQGATTPAELGARSEQRWRRWR